MQTVVSGGNVNMSLPENNPTWGTLTVNQENLIYLDKLFIQGLQRNQSRISKRIKKEEKRNQRQRQGRAARAPEDSF